MKNKELFGQSTLMPTKFKFEFLQHITNNFSEVLGQGTYGIVYKGVLNGTVIAVKKLSNHPSLHDAEFKECINLMNIQHRNIIRLIGYCYDTKKELDEYNGKRVFTDVEQRALCLEYMRGGSLSDHVSEKPCALDWRICYGIIKGICEGLKYLHTGCDKPIHHLDLKPGNILLDENKMPKIGDFGLSRHLGSAKTTWVSLTAAGTMGYMPREYILKGEITTKFDIFSLGVIIIQMMAGRDGYFGYDPMHSQEFIELVHGDWEKRIEMSPLSSKSLEVKTCIEIGLCCVEDNKTKRPTITEIVDKLNKINTTESSSTDQFMMETLDKMNEEERYAGSFSMNHTAYRPATEVIVVDKPVEPTVYPKAGICEGLALYFNKCCPGSYQKPRLMSCRCFQPRWDLRLLDRFLTLNARRRFWRCLNYCVFFFIVAAVVTSIIIVVLRFAVVPELKVDIQDARLSTFVLSDTTQNETLVYNISVIIVVHNPNRAMTITYSKPLVAAIVFGGAMLHQVIFTDEGQKHPPGKNRVTLVNFVDYTGYVGTAVRDEYKRQNATGLFTMEVRLSGEITIGIGNRRRLSLSCLYLRLGPHSPVVDMFNKVNCVPV